MSESIVEPMTMVELADVRKRLAGNASVPDPAPISRWEVARLLATVDVYHTIVDALANEGRYQAETGEGSIAYLARLVGEAATLLDNLSD